MENENIIMIEKKLYDDLVTIRHYLHSCPELSEKEYETTKYLSEKLTSWGIEILRSDLKTGLVGVIGSGNPVIALRADIDGLPVSERTNLSFASKNTGVMHACGHDLHMASLLGAAKVLKDHEAKLHGTVKLIFQPSEEHGTGANMVLQAGLVNDVQAFIGFHNIPSLGTGVIGLRDAGVMAAVEQFYVTIEGLGSHAAYPHEGVDPILAMSAIIHSLQQVVSRNVSPLKAAVLSVTHVQSGNTWNVLPSSAIFEGTLRTFDDEVRELTKSRFIEIVEGTAEAYGVRVKINWLMGTNLTYNDPELTQVVTVATKKWTREVVLPDPSSAGEDFSNYRIQAPSVFAFIGSNEAGSPGLHSDELIVQDASLSVAVQYYVHSAYALIDYFSKK